MWMRACVRACVSGCVQSCKLLNGAIPAQAAMASAVASLSSPPTMGVCGDQQLGVQAEREISL